MEETETHVDNSMIFLGEKQNGRESKNIHGHQELGKGGVELVKHVESFRVVKLVCMIL